MTNGGVKVRFLCSVKENEAFESEAADHALQLDSVGVTELPLVKIHDIDFIARLDGKKWTIKWVW